MIKNPNPTCDKECRFMTGMTTRTAAAYQPIYDKNGVNINPDMNTTTQEIYCGTCNRNWVIKKRHTEVEITETTKE